MPTDASELSYPGSKSGVSNDSSTLRAPAGRGTVIRVKSPRSVGVGRPSTVACQSGCQFSAIKRLPGAGADGSSVTFIRPGCYADTVVIVGVGFGMFFNGLGIIGW